MAEITKQNPPKIIINNQKLIDDDHSTESHWLSPIIFAANDGLVSTASLMLGMGAVSQDINAMILTGFLGLVFGSFTMGLCQFMTHDSAHDIESAGQMRKTRKDPLMAAAGMAAAFSFGALVPLLMGLFMEESEVSIGLVEGPISVVLAVFGWVGPFLDGAPGFRAVLRVLLWGWVAMVVTFGLVINNDW
ncbi:vacuolar iron transporter homolog 1-like [Amaranthus tricolor]|uniref:vacuolar iron transporter homolog 1-like n=1 Tax=Amaranthus tricolor TaxID=29722 RepID=UPI0025911B97|nr:vacuolar iron transporter homolog 1-like [Amaranthus tricolor]